MQLIQVSYEEVMYIVRACFIMPSHTIVTEKVQDITQRSWHLYFFLAAFYLLATYGSQRFVKRKYEIKWLLIVWNLWLAVFSTYGAVNVTWPLTVDLVHRGFNFTVCDEDYYVGRQQLCYWLFLFCMAKVPQLFDTAFLVLRKAPLQFLHTYHHTTVLVFSMQILAKSPGAGYWYCGMNYLEHSIMYSYFLLRSLNIYVPEIVAKCITTLQASQMFVGLFINFYSVYQKLNGNHCGNSYAHSAFAISLYLSFFLLYLRFGYQRYGKSKDKKQ